MQPKTRPLLRYTDFPALIYLLCNRSITLLNPEAWDDGNDAHYLRLYRSKKNLKSVLAICFAQASETYHHWRVFAAGAGGMSIRFHRGPFLAAVTTQSGVRAGDVKYLTIEEIKTKRLTIAEIALFKTFPFSRRE
jgi:hypothetical protein